jgi:indole-3-glycerol phosphate synthase
MHDILRNIVEQKHTEVALLQSQYSLDDLKKQKLFHRTCYSAKAAITNDKSSGIISEFKRQSPKKGPINANADIKRVVESYQEANASVVSVLTDSVFFGAHDNDFVKAREYLNIPLLRKDFLVLSKKEWVADFIYFCINLKLQPYDEKCLRTSA